MKMNDELILNCMTQEVEDDIEYNNIVTFKTSISNTPGYYIFQWTGNKQTLQGKFTCHALDTPVIIPEGELACPANSMNPMRKNYYWYHEPDESIPGKVKLKQFFMPFIQIIQYKN